MNCFFPFRTFFLNKALVFWKIEDVIIGKVSLVCLVFY